MEASHWSYSGEQNKCSSCPQSIHSPAAEIDSKQKPGKSDMLLPTVMPVPGKRLGSLLYILTAKAEGLRDHGGPP